MYNSTWYNGKSFEYKEGFISNRESYLVGMPRIRQIRVKSGIVFSEVVFIIDQ